MIKKLFFTILISLATTVFVFSQVQNKIFFKGIEGRDIKLSQLSDTAVKIITTIDLRLKEHNVTMYLTGAGYS